MSSKIEAATFKKNAKAELFISATHTPPFPGRLMASLAVIQPSSPVEDEAQKCDHSQLHVRHGETQRLVQGWMKILG